uniref:Uncharacterized protein n=1 Tax=Branchiostoma floridae TaxID=7739 RepID=C3YYM2_BRAFL|eukprot:XP_002598650.1 hypothetical protein BRAFLDRAFT_67048 [Branchiostoma floridae]
MHKDFPRKLLQATSCSGYGPYPSTGNGKYKHQGVDLELNKTSIKVPFTGILRINDSSAGLVSILVDDPDGIELIIQPITVPSSKNGMKVFKGESLGTAKTACGKSLHVAFRKAGTTDQYIDPMKYLEKRKPGFPKWNTECDDYRVVLLDLLGGGRCVASSTLDDGSLKLALKAKGLALNGSREAKLKRYRAPSAAEKFGGPIVANLDIHDPVVVSLGYLIMKPYRGTTVTFDLKVSMCGAMACIPWTEVFKQVTFDLTAATTACTNKEKAAPAAATKILGTILFYVAEYNQ